MSQDLNWTIYHGIFEIKNAGRFTRCSYSLPGEAGLVKLGKARTRCPRCGAALERWQEIKQICGVDVKKLLKLPRPRRRPPAAGRYE